MCLHTWAEYGGEYEGEKIVNVVPFFEKNGRKRSEKIYVRKKRYNAVEDQGMKTLRGMEM
jgi:hypothetical protein